MLNSQQQRAVEKIEGPCLVIAGAGTGKTKTITEKIIYLLNKGLEPARILALTFSNEAAAQMKERAEAASPLARHVSISTFHSFCADFIRAHAAQLDVSHTFSILEELDAAILLKRRLGLEAGTARWYANTISKAKDLGITIEDYKKYLEIQENLLANYQQGDLKKFYHTALVRLRTMHLDTVKSKEERTRLSEFVALYDNYRKYRDFMVAWIKYEEEKEATGALDYADLNKLVLDFVRKYGPDELAAYDYVIVDEFQDTNKVQFELLLALTSKHRNITVVGDQNQTVYAFRGAYADNIEKFRKAFQILDTVKLKENYRSTNRILRVAHKLITNNYTDSSQSVLLESAEGVEGEKARIIQMEDNREQARRVVEEIEALAKSGMAYKEITVLYRSHSSSSQLKRALGQRGIPYSVAGGNDFFYMPEIKAVVSYLYVLHNFFRPLLQADQAWWKLLHGRFGLSALDSTLLADHVKKQRRRGDTFQAVLYRDIKHIGLSRDGFAKIEKLKEIIDKLRAKRNHRISDLILEIFSETGLAREYQRQDNTRSREAMANLKRLVRLAETFESFHGDDLDSFIAYIELIDEMGGGFASSKILEEESVKLMTIHAAKGLEFEAVFLIDLVKDKFPLTRGGAEPLIPMELNEQFDEILSRTYEDDKEKEQTIKEFTSMLKEREERRLAYVALTRAKRALALTLAKDYGSKENREPSSFLLELGAEPNWFLAQNADDLDLTFTYDKEIRAKEGGDTEIDRIANEHHRLMQHALEIGDMKGMQYHAFIYKGLVSRKPVVMDKSVMARLAAKEVEKILIAAAEGKSSGMAFNPSAVSFSVTSVGTFLECAKKYELKHVLSMPSRDDEEGEGALGFGNIIHEVLDEAVKIKAKSREEVLDVLKMRVTGMTDFDTERAERIVNVFWERHGKNIGKVLATEQYFRFPIENFNFAGKIDRIDDLGRGKVRIIDYKTGYINNDVGKDDRERQLLLYALALQNDPLLKQKNWAPSELTLEMLEKEKPLEFTLINGQMAPKEGRIKPVTVEEVKRSVLDTMKQIAAAYETSFPVAASDVPCRFCPYKLYCPKWG